MDGATLAVLITSLSGAALGAAGFFQARYRDTNAARATAQDVASKAASAAVGALNAALDRQQGEIEFLTGRVDNLTTAVLQCEAEKIELRELVRALQEG